MDGLGLVLDTHLMRLTGFRATTRESPRLSREAEGTCSDVNPVPQHSSLGARWSTYPSQIPILPSNYTAPSCRRRGSEWCLLIFVIKSKHHVLVKTKTVSMFKILPSTWHLCLSIKCFAVIASLQACHLFLITDLNDSIEIKYMQV